MELLFLLPPGLIYCQHNVAYGHGEQLALLYTNEMVQSLQTAGVPCQSVLEQDNNMPSAKSLNVSVRMSHSLPLGEHFELT